MILLLRKIGERFEISCPFKYKDILMMKRNDKSKPKRLRIDRLHE